MTADPYWVEGMWHDTQSTFIRFQRAVGEEIAVAGFLSDGTARVLPHEVIGVGLVIRIDGVVEAGILGVGDPGAGRPVAHQGGGRAVAQWQLKVPAGVVPKNLPVYIALGLVAVLLLVMLLTGSGAPSDESAAGGEQAIEAAVADVRNVVEPVLREGERLREDLARLEAQRQADEEASSRQEAAARDEDLADARLELEGARAALLEAQRIRDAAESAAGSRPGRSPGTSRRRSRRSRSGSFGRRSGSRRSSASRCRSARRPSWAIPAGPPRLSGRPRRRP